jgi:hypothetical protein
LAVSTAARCSGFRFESCGGKMASPGGKYPVSSVPVRASNFGSILFL